jgi:hypothetical protein
MCYGFCQTIAGLAGMGNLQMMRVLIKEIIINLR